MFRYQNNTNFENLITISLQSHGVDLPYCKLWILLDKIDAQCLIYQKFKKLQDIGIKSLWWVFILFRLSRGTVANNSPEPSFLEFIKYILNTDITADDEHWQPISLRCRYLKGLFPFLKNEHNSLFSFLTIKSLESIYTTSARV